MPPGTAFRLAFVLTSLIAAGCGGPPKANSPEPGSGAAEAGSSPLSVQSISQGYVGSAACSSCHAEEANAWHGHPMYKSLSPAIDADPVEDYEHASFSTADSLTYYVERTPTEILHHEKRVDAKGDVIYDQGVPIAFTVGSGARGRSYLVNVDGRMYVSPISWYSGPGKWDLSPGYEPGNHRRFERRISDGCASCHTGRVAIHGEQESRFLPEPFPEPAIGCERCHGPGKEHADRHTAGVVDSSPDPIFNPASVSDARRDAVCNQCHLQGLLRVVRSGRSEYDFRPGSYLSDNWIIFRKTAGVESGSAAAVSQVEQMYASRCYTQSGGALSCIGCHGGHSLPSGESYRDFYRTQCVGCHRTGSSECTEQPDLRRAADNDSCVACHMPKVPAADVHAAQTDHRILRRPATTAQNASPRGLSFRDSPMVLFVEPGVTVPQMELSRARGIFLADQASAGGTEAQAKRAIDLLLETMKAFPDDIESRYKVGLAFERLGQPQLAIQAWEYVLTRRPAHEDALEALGGNFLLNRNYSGARKYYERLLEINPERSLVHGRLAHVLGKLGDPRRSIEYAKKSLELNPSLVQSHVWLAEIYRLTGDEENAAIHAAIVEQFRSGATPSEPSAK